MIQPQEMKPVVYFAQPTNGGPIKIGSTIHLPTRRQQLNAGAFGGVEILASIPGYLIRERFLGIALEPWRARNEWFRSCVEVWRVIIEIGEQNDLPWLPSEPFKEAYLDGCSRLHPKPLRRDRAAELFRVAQIERTLPPWLLAAHAPAEAA